MACCTGGYTSTQTKEEGKTCDVRLEALIVELESKREESEEIKEESKRGKGRECENTKPPSKKKFLEIGPKQICAIPYTRKWKLESSPESSPDEPPNSFKLKKRTPYRGTCPRELDDYMKSLWTPFCKPKEKPLECRDPIDPRVCIFCLESLYTGGYIHDLFEKVPIIKKQSEKYGDEIAWRIGIRTRVTVHKKCYSSYIDTFTHESEKENEIDIDLGNDEVEESEDLNCGEEEGEEEEENIEEEKEKKRKGSGVSKNPRKQNFCLQKFLIPKIDSGVCACACRPGKKNLGKIFQVAKPKSN